MPERTPVPESDRFISTTEAGELLGISRQAVRLLCVSGKLPHFRPTEARKIVLKLKDVLTYQQAHAYGGEPRQTESV